jgi:hypothetical protein
MRPWARKDHPALPFEEFLPDHEIGDAGLVLDGDEDDAFGRAQHLPQEACCLKPPSVARLHRLGAGDYVLVAKVSAQEGDRMAAQAQAHMAIVLDHFAASGHRPECYSRFIDLNRT